jgi:sRNA-binding regulator protein Hfq
MMQVARSMDFLDNGIAVTGIVRGFDKIAVHGLPLWNNG